MIEQTRDESNTPSHNRADPPSHNPSMPQITPFSESPLSAQALQKIDTYIVEKFNELRQRAHQQDPILESECIIPVTVVASSEFSLTSLNQNPALSNVSQLVGEVFGAQLDLRKLESLSNANDVVMVELERMNEALED